MDNLKNIDIKKLERDRLKKITESKGLPSVLNRSHIYRIEAWIKSLSQRGGKVSYENLSFIDTIYILNNTDSYLDADEQAIVIRKTRR